MIRQERRSEEQDLQARIRRLDAAERMALFVRNYRKAREAAEERLVLREELAKHRPAGAKVSA